MNDITRETRSESIRKVDRAKRGQMILEAMGTEEMTAREIAYKLGFSDLNAVKPRLTEMAEAGYVEAIGKRRDALTRRTVTIWKAVDINA